MNQVTKRFLQIEELFNEALEAPDDLRAELVNLRCGADRALAGEVRALLDACRAEEQLVASSRREPGNGRSARPERKRVGPYEIDRVLGRGGMGAVYLAHRADGQYEQKVAVKLIDLPVATELFRERFRQERQILAGLAHKYIAHLLDGGVTDQGDLYLAMEYVDGAPIHRFCNERKLSQKQRIELFLQVCEAVQFAHQNFVVHRDLKPDNILVVDDGTPRLLDFGTAKLVSPSLEKQESQLTRAGYLSFTPQYASPEQVLGNVITTASDTYSLGVLLYLLLTGAMPYTFEELSTAEMLRAVCEEAPRRPSLQTGKRLDGDLEAILLKALRKEPQERYLTAEQLAGDLHAFLDGQPVAARRGNARYRAGKFIRRHRLALAASSLLAVSLIAGVVGVAWQAQVANQQRRIAETERHKAEARSADLRQLSDSLLSELDDAIQQLPGSTKVQTLLVTRVLEHLDRMAEDAKGDRQTELELVNAYTRLGNLQGDPYYQNLGDTTGALASIDKAIALGAPLAAGGSDDREALRALAQAQTSRSEILTDATLTGDAIASIRAAISTYERLLTIPGATPNDICDTGNAYANLGDELGQGDGESLNEMASALSAYHRYVDLMNRAHNLDQNLIRPKRGLAIGQLKIGLSEEDTDPAQALKDLQIGLRRVASLPTGEQGTLQMVRVRGNLLMNEADVLLQFGQYHQAIAIEADAFKLFQKLAAADPQDLRALFDMQISLDHQVNVFETAADPDLGATPRDRLRNLASAAKLLAPEIAVLERMLKKNPSQDEWKSYLANAQVSLGSDQYIVNGAVDSADLVKKGLATLRSLATKNGSSPAILNSAAQHFLSAEPASLKDARFATLCAERAVALSHRTIPPYLLTLAQAERAAGHVEKSRATALEGLALLPTSRPGDVKPTIRKLLEIQAQSGK